MEEYIKKYLVKAFKYNEIDNKYTLITNKGNLSESDLIISASGFIVIRLHKI